jgi:phosphatidylinositol alpha-1,6-mannosyltransferase
VEAQACGKAVIAGDSGGTRETMQVGTSGFITDCTNVENIESTLNKLILEPDLLNKMGANATSHVNDTFEWRQHVKKALSYFVSD